MHKILQFFTPRTDPTVRLETAALRISFSIFQMITKQLSLVILLLVPIAYTLIAYDCGGTHLNVTTISLLKTKDCDLEIKETASTSKYIQLLQLTTYGTTEVWQCKVEITRTIFHCGMHSHISMVRNGQAQYLREVTREACLRAHQEGILRIGATDIMDDLKGNTTHYRTLTLAGENNIDGTCKGVHYSDYYGSWADVVVQGSAKITLKNGYVPVHLSAGKVVLKSGTTCSLTDEGCMDSDDGNTFWKAIPAIGCSFEEYDVLYEGNANKTIGSVNELQTTIYSLETGEITFSLAQRKLHNHCGHTLTATEHPKLFILETAPTNVIKRRGKTPTNNLDLFTYVNSKFVYVERYIRSQMTSLYEDVVKQKCELEKQVLQNTLSLATMVPDEFAFFYSPN